MLNACFYTDYQDLLALIIYFRPELLLAGLDYICRFWYYNISELAPASVFDTYQDATNSTISAFTEFVIGFCILACAAIIFLEVFRFTGLRASLGVYTARIVHYFYSLAREFRLQFEHALQLFFIFFLYYTQLIATFDEDREELIEIFDVTLFYFFCSVIALFFYKHSIHYFAFLEATVSDGRAVLFVAKQFFRDFINTFAMLLRFFILLFRLNVYDTLDDFYDSYYVFMGDFDDDEYFTELLAPIFGLYFFDTDSGDDRSFLYKDEEDFTSNLFYYYFLC
jgi:hypothetical protein